MPPRRDEACEEVVASARAAEAVKTVECAVPHADWGGAVWTLVSTTAALLAASVAPPCAATFALIPLLFVRMFIIFHDCTHNSFTPSPAANVAIGHVRAARATPLWVDGPCEGSLGARLTLSRHPRAQFCEFWVQTPFRLWQKGHMIHHARQGNLDKVRSTPRARSDSPSRAAARTAG